jgi:maltooligosyltrehalose trehalohydrolase
MEPEPNGYFQLKVDGIRPGAHYLFRLGDGGHRPDPASRSQPAGVHGPSEVIDTHFAWHDEDWSGLDLADYILYELHVGTFTAQGTFDAAIGELDRLCDLGVTAIEIMPVAQFPGPRNWGYDGVYPFAVQNSYGGPLGLARFVDACHEKGLAVVLDVVYNHIGPDGNQLRHFAPYFTERYKNPWGESFNFDGRHSDEVRRYFLANALYWQTEFHIDGLRLDAVDSIKDFSTWHFLAELAEVTRRQANRLGRRFHLIGESDLNDVRLLRSPECGGHGLAGQWCDDFHHAVHALLTGERAGYYQDFGPLEQLARPYRHGYGFTGQFSAYRGRRHGSPSRGQPAQQFVVYIQNHDQVGNRPHGERLGSLVDFESLKLAAGLLLLSPCTPMLFMGEEYGETAPFLYFISHDDPRIAESVRRGRRREFADFGWPPGVREPDPQAEETFLRSRLRTEQAQEGPGRVLHDFYRELIYLRRTISALVRSGNEHMEVRAFENHGSLFVHRWADGDAVVVLYQIGPPMGRTPWPIPTGTWRKLLDSSAPSWQGPGNELPVSLTSGGEVELELGARSFVLYQQCVTSI